MSRPGLVLGEWPAAAAEAGQADVVVAHHVLHNVVDLPPFLRALTAAARRGVVVEMLDQHPMAWLDPLWERFHGLRRPPPATADDAVAVLREIGLAPEVTRWERPNPPRQDPAWVARRLCLPPEAWPSRRSAESSPPRTAVTLTWRPSPRLHRRHSSTRGAPPPAGRPPTHHAANAATRRRATAGDSPSRSGATHRRRSGGLAGRKGTRRERERRLAGAGGRDR